MEYNNLLELIKTVSESNLSCFQYEDGTTKIHMSSVDEEQNTEPIVKVANMDNTETDMGQVVPPVINATQMSENDTQVETGSDFTGKMITSPLVGTFYAAPSEDKAPFVSIGDQVKEGQILAIVEAMKLMNDIESDYDGVVKKILVQNGQSVEYGQPLFVIE